MKTLAELTAHLKEHPNMNSYDIYQLGGDDKRYEIRNDVTENVIAKLHKSPSVWLKMQNFFSIIRHIKLAIILFWVGFNSLWALGIDRELIGIQIKNKRKEYKKELPVKKLRKKERDMELKIERLTKEREKIIKEISSKPLP